jgi:hypothetical protein
MIPACNRWLGLHDAISQKMTKFRNDSCRNIRPYWDLFAFCDRPPPAVAADPPGSHGQVLRHSSSLLCLPAVHGALPHLSASNRNLIGRASSDTRGDIQSLHRIFGMHTATGYWLSRHQNVLQNREIKIANRWFQNVPCPNIKGGT